MDVHTENLDIKNNKESSRYEVDVNGKDAFAVYQIDGKRIIFTHTEVPPELEGRGIAGNIVQIALDDSRAQGLQVVPVCPFVSAYIKRHQEYLDLVDPEYREAVQRTKPSR